jgi:hypothetical protein
MITKEQLIVIYFNIACNLAKETLCVFSILMLVLEYFMRCPHIKMSSFSHCVGFFREESIDVAFTRMMARQIF